MFRFKVTLTFGMLALAACDLVQDPVVTAPIQVPEPVEVKRETAFVAQGRLTKLLMAKDDVVAIVADGRLAAWPIDDLYSRLETLTPAQRVPQYKLRVRIDPGRRTSMWFGGRSLSPDARIGQGRSRAAGWAEGKLLSLRRSLALDPLDRKGAHHLLVIGADC